MRSNAEGESMPFFRLSVAQTLHGPVQWAAIGGRILEARAAGRHGRKATEIFRRTFPARDAQVTVAPLAGGLPASCRGTIGRLGYCPFRPQLDHRGICL